MKKLGFILFVFLFIFIGGTVSANSLEQRIAVTQKSSTGITASCDVNEKHTLYAALYKNTELITIASSDTKEVTLPFRTNQEDEYVIKLFCWGDANNTTPLSLPLTVDCSDLYDIGILKNIYKRSGGVYYAQIITPEGLEKEYPVDTWNAQNYQILGLSYLSTDGVTYDFGEHSKSNSYPNQVIRYVIDSSDKLAVKDQLSPTVSSQSNNGIVAYNTQTNSIGDVNIGDNAYILDISNVDDNRIKIITTADLVNGLNYKAYGYMQSDNNSSSSIVLIAQCDAVFNIGLLQDKSNDSVNIYPLNEDYHNDTYTIEEGYYVSTGKENTLSSHIDELMQISPSKRFVRYLHDGLSLYDIELINPTEYVGIYSANAIGNYALSSDYINYYDETDGIIRISKNGLKSNCEYTIDIFQHGTWSYELVSGGELSEDDMYSVGILKNIYKSIMLKS